MTGLPGSHWEQMIRPEYNRTLLLLVHRGLQRDLFYRLVEPQRRLHGNPRFSIHNAAADAVLP